MHLRTLDYKIKKLEKVKVCCGPSIGRHSSNIENRKNNV